MQAAHNIQVTGLQVHDVEDSPHEMADRQWCLHKEQSSSEQDGLAMALHLFSQFGDSR
jgi:hypothetical protein